MKTKLLIMCVVISMILSVGSTALADIINGGFETGTLAGWATGNSYYGSGPAQALSTGVNGIPPSEGSYCAYLETLAHDQADNLCYSYLQQEFQAEVGEVLAFDYAVHLVAHGLQVGEPDHFRAEAEFQLMVYRTDLGPGTTEVDLLLEAYAIGDETYTTSTGGWASDGCTFTEAGTYVLSVRIEGQVFREPMGPSPDPGGDLPYAMCMASVDNVSLIPEPAALALLAVGALGLIRNRK